jgi:arabinan endo-1,5-alpha-L-arabinosidase
MRTRFFSSSIRIGIVSLILMTLFVTTSGSPAQALSGSIGIHDPSVIQASNGCFYAFGTGTWLPILKSCGMFGSWARLKNVFSSLPSWIPSVIGSSPGNLWAPDINFFNGKYYLYYAASTFGSNTSVIGLATATDIEGTWTDQGEVLRSNSSNNFNAIDPDYNGGWLSFGSFWDGIKMRKINTTTGKLDTSNTTLVSLASRGGGAIEAPSIQFNGGFYYLFVSFDKCCAGLSSTYRIMVGRSTSITGPYVDQNGVNMRNGGGTQLLATNGAEVGPGGQDVMGNYMVYHFYDGNANGAAKLNIRPINFSNGWPVLGAPISGNVTPVPTVGVPTNTPVVPTRTNTPVTPTSVSPTRTSTPVTPTSVPPTRTNTPIGATSVPTSTFVPPTRTSIPATPNGSDPCASPTVITGGGTFAITTTAKCFK